MLAFCIGLHSEQHRWKFNDGRWHGSAGTIQPFTNPCIQVTADQPSPGVLDDAGIWPIAPFANPYLARFACQLPSEWAANKRVLRNRLTRTGLPRIVASPAGGEDFTPIMQRGMRTHALPLLERLLDDLVLADLGYVERAAVRQALEDAQSAPVAGPSSCPTAAAGGTSRTASAPSTAPTRRSARSANKPTPP